MKPYSLALLAATAMLLQYLSFGLTENVSPGVQNYSMPTNQSTQEQARVLWEQAIAAKGGREKLYGVKNMAISSRAEYGTHLGKRNSIQQEELFVFPHKMWTWNDMRPDVFGLRVEMYNYEARTFYILVPDDPDKKTRQVANHKRWEDSTLLNTQLFYFMETKWVQPMPIAVYEGEIRKQAVDIVQTQVNGKRVDFALDPVTHLPVRFVVYGIVGGALIPIVVADLADYVEVSGIKVPQKATPENGSTFNSKIQINVDYNEIIFVRPTTIEAGPEAWRPKK
jgi:hypothetical protein